MLSVLQKAGIPAEHMKPEFGPPETKIVYTPPSTRPQILATFGTSNGWKINSELLHSSLPTATPEKIMEDYATLE